MSAVSVLMYSTPTCPYCRMAESLLRSKGVAPQQIRVDRDPQQRQIMMTRSHGRHTVPQIFIGEQHVGGYDDLAALDKKGLLDGLLRGES